MVSNKISKASYKLSTAVNFCIEHQMKTKPKFPYTILENYMYYRNYYPDFYRNNLYYCDHNHLLFKK